MTAIDNRNSSETVETTFAVTTAAIEAGNEEVGTQGAAQVAQQLITTLLGNNLGSPEGVVTTLEALEGLRQSWETNEMAASHRRLYAILSSCYAFYIRMKSKSTGSEVRANMRKGLDRFIRSRNLRTLADTHDMNRVVKAVFGEDRRRVSAYAAALKVALTAGPTSLTGEVFPVDPGQLSDWISQQGGVEEIRKAKSGDAVPISERVAKAQAAVQAAPLTSFKPNARELAFDSDDIDKPQVLIATYRPSGELEINCVIKSQSVVSAALAFYYAKHKEALQTPVAAEAEVSATAAALEQTI